MNAEAIFPAQYARTGQFTLGVPRAFRIAPDGVRMAFLRTRTGADTRTCLWVRDAADGAERLIADPVGLLDGGADRPPQAERTLRERTRESAVGITSFAVDRAVRTAVFALSGHLFHVDLGSGRVHGVPAAPGAVAPRLDPAGTRIAYVAGGALHVTSSHGPDTTLAESEDPEVTWGLPEFVAAEEMGRTRGFWWAPDGQSLLVARVDTGEVAKWYLSDPASPHRPPHRVPYPAAGTANAAVTLWRVALNGNRHRIRWDETALPYLSAVHWSGNGPALLQVQSRDQRILRVLSVADDGTTEVRAEEIDAHWVSVVPGAPAWTTDGRLARVAARRGAYRLLIDDRPVTPDGLQVRALLDVGDDVLFTASGDDPTQIHVHSAGPGAGTEQWTEAPGVHHAARSGRVLVTVSQSLHRPGTVVHVHTAGCRTGSLVSVAEKPVLTARPHLLSVGDRALRCAVLLPAGHRPGDGSLPVLLDPYGGPAAQRVLAAHDKYLFSQWFAEQGFAVLVADGRGTPGRGPVWDRSIQFDEARMNVEDQVDALRATAERFPGLLDLDRVAIRGWSHGGYLALLAVLRRPDVFHAAVAGAPVTDRLLYNTFYTERYLGHPEGRADVYAANSPLTEAASLCRPLMLIHGLADDNVVAAHTLRLSSALLAAGRPHTVLPLSAATHRTPHAMVEGVMRSQSHFLKQALAARPKESVAHGHQ
ncbi:prolyl oligopeptidase family serine peptidase [Streptomyces sp. NPDC005899]|uniref:prolyl oligopeptidase family serine peptidase n=1 Tax=Streptomyces sp. NPDC005899 TaxID=3155716 RepID=UPI0033E072DE